MFTTLAFVEIFLIHSVKMSNQREVIIELDLQNKNFRQKTVISDKIYNTPSQQGFFETLCHHHLSVCVRYVRIYGLLPWKIKSPIASLYYSGNMFVCLESVQDQDPISGKLIFRVSAGLISLI